jgi:hypothetical protein
MHNAFEGQIFRQKRTGHHSLAVAGGLEQGFRRGGFPAFPLLMGNGATDFKREPTATTHFMKTTKLTATLVHFIHSPKGAIEGMLVNSGGKAAQVIFPPHLADSIGFGFKEGTKLKLVVEAFHAGPSHPVYELVEILKEPGSVAAKATPAGKNTVTKGKVQRLNYARHGQPNGVILDNGDFVHTRPDNMAKLGLNVGDTVEASGEARVMSSGAKVIEATIVNKTKLAKKVAKKAAKKAAKKTAKKAVKKVPR